jgi:hypothetical protein
MVPHNLDVHEATISFPLRYQHCRITELQADNTVIDGTLDLHSSTIQGDLSLPSTDIRSDLYLSDKSVVSSTLDADRLTVTGSVFLRDGSTFTTIDLLDANIGGQLTLSGGSVVSGTLDANRATVTGDVFLRNRSTFTTIDLLGADIGGLIYLNGANWQPDGSLDLEQTRASGIYTDHQADSWPHTLRLNGFVFQQWTNPDPRTLGSDWFTHTWPARHKPFSPNPYNQLATVMHTSEHPTIAADIRYHRSHAERNEIPRNRPEHWARTLHWLILGYGFRPWRALGWFTTVWLTGCLIFTYQPHHNPNQPNDPADRPPPRRIHRWQKPITGLRRIRLANAAQWSLGQAALYSLDRLLPAVKLVDPDEFPPRTRTQQTWSVTQILLGWLLTLFIVGWLGSLLVQPNP